MSVRVIVVGGGVIGVCAAHRLAARGADVVLLEREGLAAGASFGNAGTVSADHLPLNKRSRILNAFSQLADPTGPLYIKPRWDPELYRWLADFARHCTDEHVRRCMDVMAPLGMEALRLFDEVVEEESLDCGYARDGYFEVCQTESGLADSTADAGIVRGYGYHPETLDADAMRAAEPALGGDVLGGVFHPEAATLHPHRFVTALAAAATARGAQLRLGAEVEDVLVEGDRAVGVQLRDGERLAADAIVLATGPFSLDLSHRLGTRLPVQPGKGYHRDLPVGAGGSPALRIACVLHEVSVFCTPMRGFVRYAGTMEFSGLNHEMRPDRLEQLTRGARRYFPGLGADAPLSEWCGLRPMTSDGLPIVGPLPGVEGVVVATGHGMLGLTLGPATGAIVADWVIDGEPAPLWRRMSPGRF